MTVRVEYEEYALFGIFAEEYEARMKTRVAACVLR